jgi:type II secretory pathway component GspD/PulD (secretin)
MTMNRTKIIRTVVGALLAVTAGMASAQHALEIISLRHRTVEQVLPALRPLLEPGGTLTGQASQLIVRASPANVAELRRALAAIDRPLRRLQISVRFDDSSRAEQRDIEASGRISNRDSRFELRARDARSDSAERVDQRVQVLEGSRATIHTGQSRPLSQRQFIQTPGGVVSQEIVVVQELTTGFEVVPRLAGDTVTLEVAPQRHSGEAYQRAATRVSARLGQWTELGAVVHDSSQTGRGIASASRSSGSESRRVWVKVEEIAD